MKKQLERQGVNKESIIKWWIAAPVMITLFFLVTLILRFVIELFS